jgi:hypothetical protein
MAEEELTMEKLIEKLRKLKELAAKLPPEFQGEHKELSDLYEKVRRAQSGLSVYPPDEMNGN